MIDVELADMLTKLREGSEVIKSIRDRILKEAIFETDKEIISAIDDKSCKIINDEGDFLLG